jgi:hypothetical protein
VGIRPLNMTAACSMPPRPMMAALNHNGGKLGTLGVSVLHGAE